MRLLISLFLIALLGTSCTDKAPTAQLIVDKAITAHGGEKYEQSVVSFKLRDRDYRSLRDGGAYVYSRTFTDSTVQRVYDVLRNSGFQRTINDVVVELPEERIKAYSNSINSVIYFALLPYFLNDAAVQKEFLGETTINGEHYYKVKVTFDEKGGGEDHEDVYIYWFHQKNHTMDYLAYSFIVDGGGTRFREAVNVRETGGIRFQDYVNYTSETAIKLADYDKAFEAGKLKKISDINLEEVQVSALPK